LIDVVHAHSYGIGRDITEPCRSGCGQDPRAR
jgi:hypothetical protein